MDKQASSTGAATAPTDRELIERLDDWACVLDRATSFLAKGQYSRIYEAAFRTAADIRAYVARLKGQKESAVPVPAVAVQAEGSQADPSREKELEAALNLERVARQQAERALVTAQALADAHRQDSETLDELQDAGYPTIRDAAAGFAALRAQLTASEQARIEAIQAWDRENELRRDAEEELAALKATTVSHATDVDDAGKDTP